MPERTPNISPQKIIIYSFEYLNVKTISLTELVNFCLKMNCPSEQVARKVIANMVEKGDLNATEGKDNEIYLNLNVSN